MMYRVMGSALLLASCTAMAAPIPTSLTGGPTFYTGTVRMNQPVAEEDWASREATRRQWMPSSKQGPRPGSH